MKPPNKFKVGDEVIIGTVDPEYVKANPAYAALSGKRGGVKFVHTVSTKSGDTYYKVSIYGIYLGVGLDFKENELLPAGCEVTGVLDICGDI